MIESLVSCRIGLDQESWAGTFEIAAFPPCCIVPPEVQILMIIPGNAYNVEVTIAVEIRHAGSEMAFPAIGHHMLYPAGSVSDIFEYLYFFGAPMLGGDYVEIAVVIHIGEIAVIARVLYRNDMALPGSRFRIAGTLEP